MSDYAQLGLLASCFAGLHYVIVSRIRGVLNLDGIFVISQWLLCVGTLALLDPSSRAHQQYSIVVTAPLILYVLISIGLFVGLSAKETRAGRADRTYAAASPTKATSVLLALSILVTVIYFRAVGYNVLSLGIQNMFSPAQQDIATLRVQSYSGASYFFPGYVNQFKNVLLPCLTVVFAIYWHNTKRPFRKTITFALALASVFGLLGTGQRGALVLFVYTLITFLYQVNRTLFAKRAARVGLVAMPLFLVATAILGRSSSALAQAQGTFGKLGVLLDESTGRFLHDNQASGIAGFEYTFGRPTQNGTEWWQGLIGLLPGKPGSSLSAEIFATLYGSTRGTAPPSLWGSAYYNFGMAGVVALPVVLAIIYGLVSFHIGQLKHVNSLQVIGISGVSVVAGTWIAGGPDSLLNAGLGAYVALWWLGSRQPESQPLEDREMTAHTNKTPVGVHTP